MHSGFETRRSNAHFELGIPNVYGVASIQSVENDLEEGFRMHSELIEFLLWGLALHYAMLLLWFLMFRKWHKTLYRLHFRFFNISEKNFDSIHYLLMGLYKIGIFIFILIPLISLLIVRN